MSAGKPFIPTADMRLNQYHLNKGTLQGFQGIPRRAYDWEITATFYAALHLIEQKLIKIEGTKYRKHEERLKLVVTDEKLGEEVALAFQALFNESIAARYDCRPISQKRAQDAIDYLTEIENNVPK